jgi:hypothetical protein
MPRECRHFCTAVLAACMLLVPILISPAVVAHEVQHGHHDAAAHSSPLCSWICGAGEGFSLTLPSFEPTLIHLVTLWVEAPCPFSNTPLFLSLSRGPPVLLAI